MFVGACGVPQRAEQAARSVEVVADPTAETLKNSKIVHAIAILQGREHAVRECQASKGITRSSRYQPMVDLVSSEPSVAGYGLATTLSGAGMQDAVAREDAARSQPSNDQRLKGLPAAQRRAWAECVDQWTGSERMSADAALYGEVATLMQEATENAMSLPSVAKAHRSWSDCIRQGTGLDVPDPAALRTRIEDEWTTVLSANSLPAQESSADRIAAFADYEVHVASVDSSCYSEHLRATWESAFLTALDERAAASEALLRDVESSRPPYDSWSAVEAEIVNGIVE